MLEPSHILTRSDAKRVKRAVRHVETLSREHINVTPVITPAGEFCGASPQSTITHPIEVTGDPPGGSTELSTLYLGTAYIRGSESLDTWTELSILIRPVDDEIERIQIGMQMLGMYIGDCTEAGPYLGTPIFTSASTPFGCGIVFDPGTGTWTIDLGTIAGDGLTVDPGVDGACPKLKVVTGGGSETIGCGLSRAGGNLHVDLTDVVTDGITWNAELCGLSWNPGCGTQVGVSPSNGESAIAVNFDTLAGEADVSSLIVIGTPPVAEGDPCPSLGVDLTVVSETTEVLVTDVSLSVVAGKLRLTKSTDTFKNYFNAAGLHIDRVLFSTATTYSDLDLCTLVACCSAEPLTVECTRSGSTGNAPYSVDFTATPSGGVPPYTYYWDFDDGTDSTDQNPTHVYTTDGTFNPFVIVTDSCGNVSDPCYPGTISVTGPGECCGITTEVGIIPGTSCAAATVLTVGTYYWYMTVGVAGTESWFKLVVPAGSTYCFHVSDPCGAGGLSLVTGYTGADCGSLSTYYGPSVGFTSLDLPGGVGGITYWFKLLTNNAGVCIKVDYTDGACS